MVRFAIRLTPRAGLDRIDGVDENGALKVRVRAAPVDGAANVALIELLATHLRVPRTSLSIGAGASARRKLIELDDRYQERLKSAWPELRF